MVALVVDDLGAVYLHLGFDLCLFFDWSPEETNVGLALKLQIVQVLVESLLFGKEHLENVDP